jgi:hypothetical protein
MIHVKGGLMNVEGRLDRVEQKIDAFAVLHRNHETRITRLERKAV